ncbi:MAG: glycosyltransferase family 4 protein [Bacteroidetes bacterium]|nr:glycosyltransferase family 4 protein [Bacteroidota bacterium]
MKIALLTDGVFPYVIGGMQKHSFYLAKYFALNKIEVDLYHTANDLSKADSLDCFTSEEKKYIRSIVIPFPKLDRFPGHYIREMYAYSAAIFSKMKGNRPVDFIYVQGFCGMKLLENKDQIKIPIGVNFHGLEMFQKAANLRSKLEQFIFRKPVLRILKNADVVFSLGGKLTELMLLHGIPKEKISQISIGIDPSWIREEEIMQHSNMTFVFVGRYERRKGIEELMMVLNNIKEQSFEFHFVGAIPVAKQLKAPHIHYWGNIADSSIIKDILKTSDVLVCPSYSEGMPTVILEAMASGLAIIASDVGAVSEQVNEANGILIQPGNNEALEQALLKMLKVSPDLLISMKRNSIAAIQKQFLWEEIIAKNISEIQRFIK